MGTVATTTNTLPIQYPGNRLVSKINGRNLWIVLYKASTADNYVFATSTDSGANWATLRTIVRANVTDIGSIFTDNYGWVYWCYRTNETGSDRIMVRRIEAATGSNKPDTGELELGSLANGGTPGAAISGMDVTSHYNTSNGYHYVVVAHGIVSGGQIGLGLVAANIDPSGTIGNGTYRFSGTRSWLYTATAGRHGVSIDKEHNGDGYEGGQSPNLWCSFMRSDIRLVKVPWSGDGWTGSPGSTLVKAGVGARDSQASLWDGQRFLMVTPDPVITDRVLLLERNRANSSTATRQSPAHPTGVVRQATMGYDFATGNVRLFAVGTSTAVLYNVDYVRATDTWGAWVAVTGSPAVIGANVDNYGCKVSTYQDAKHGIYVATGTTPFTLSYISQSVAYAPNTPTWAAPPNNTAQDVGAALALSWVFSDTDPGDTQSAYALSRQIGAGAVQYFTAAGATWGGVEVQNATSTTGVTLASGWAVATDANYTYKVRVWDTTPQPSAAYSAGLIITPSTPVNPAITAPTAAQVLATNNVTITWTAAEQTQYRVQLNVQGGAQVYDSGYIGDSVARSFLVPYVLLNGTLWTLTLTTKNLEGLPSVAQTRNFSITYIPPMTPTLAAIAVPAQGYTSVVISNPTPTGGAPVVQSQELFRRVTGTTTVTRIGASLANNATVQDWRAVHGVSYEYQVATLGVNGTSTSGAWTA